MKNLSIQGFYLKNPAASTVTTATHIFKNGLDLSQSSESVFKDDEPVTPFRDLMSEQYNPFSKDPDAIHQDENPNSSDAAEPLTTEKTE